MITLPQTLEVEIEMNNRLLSSLTNNPRADLYRIVSHEAMCAQFFGVRSMSNLFYYVCILDKAYYCEKLNDIKEQSGALNLLFDLAKEMDQQIQLQQYNKTLYHKVMSVSRDLSPIQQLNEAVLILYKGSSIKEQVNGIYSYLQQIIEYHAATLIYHYTEILPLSDNQIINRMAMLSKENK